MLSNRLFAYGTLLAPAVQRRIIGRVVAVTPASLPNYAVKTIILGGTPYPRIEPAIGGMVEGGVLLLTQAELTRTDEYEGADYTRIVVTLQDGTTAFVYVRPQGA